MENWQSGGFGLYIHWPFCQSKCPYCDFNSHVASTIDQDRWKRAYLSEIDRLAEQTPGRVLNTVFFGGGTPSLMEAHLVADILQRVRDRWTISNDFEATLEANPGSADASRFEGYRDGGINRLSMGLQALNDSDLKRLGRLHTAKEAQIALGLAKEYFNRVSFDLIYARQEQSLSEWKAELTHALAMAADHLSLYQLTIEEGTAFGDRHARGRLAGLPTEDLAADFYNITQEICDKAGLHAYEVSNHAKKGAESAHNQIYWRGGDYIGIGPGAHGRLQFGAVRYATECPKAPGKWLQSVETAGNGELPREIITGSERASEYVMMSMRLSEGMSLSRLASMGSDVAIHNRALMLQELGMVETGNDRIVATPKGRVVLNEVIRQLLVA